MNSLPSAKDIALSPFAFEKWRVIISATYWNHAKNKPSAV